MKIKEFMERAGIAETGRAIAYIKDGLKELNMMFSTHTDNERISIVKEQRVYDFPDDMVKVIDIRMLNHRNDKDEYRSIPRLMHPPTIKDGDGS